MGILKNFRSGKYGGIMCGLIEKRDVFLVKLLYFCR